MCTANVRIIPIAIYILKNALRFNLRVHNFKNFPGEHAPDPLAIACMLCMLAMLSIVF